MKRIIFVSITIICIGCGGASEKSSNVISVEDYETSTFSVEAQESSVEGLLGNVTDEESQRVFNNHMRKLLKCYEDAVFDLEEIEGEILFELEVASDGSVNHAFVSQSNVGSIETESCMLKYVRGFRFDRAPGGVAILSYPLELVPPYDHPAPIAWPADKLDPVVAEHREEISGCLGGQSGATVTLYIGQGGVVLSAGASADAVDVYEGAACVARAARGWAFDDPGGKLVKVGLDF
jgi:hypothetical protein